MQGIQDVILPSPKAMARSKYHKGQQAKKRDSIRLESPSHSQSSASRSVTPVCMFDDETISSPKSLRTISPMNAHLIQPVPVKVKDNSAAAAAVEKQLDVEEGKEQN